MNIPDALMAAIESLAIIGLTLIGCACWLALVVTLAGGAK
jgi:hypothetical protein